MKKFILLLMILVIQQGFSQVNSGYDGPKPEVRAGSKSFVFYYTPFQSNFDPVYVSTVSVYPEDEMDLVGAGFRFFFTHQFAVTFGWNFGTASSTQEFINGDVEETTATSIGISADGNFHFNSLYSVSPYIGANLNYGTYTAEIVETTAGITTTTEFTGSGFGIGVNFGFDWYFTEGLSLGGKYTLGFQNLTRPEQTIGTSTTEGLTSSFFGIGSASVVLNVHF
jgi:hypothetical protein